MNLAVSIPTRKPKASRTHYFRDVPGKLRGIGLTWRRARCWLFHGKYRERRVVAFSGDGFRPYRYIECTLCLGRVGFKTDSNLTFRGCPLVFRDHF